MFPRGVLPSVSQGTLVNYGNPAAHETSGGKLYLYDGYTVSGITYSTNLELEYWNGSSWVNFYNASISDGVFNNYTTTINFATGIKIRARLTSALGSTAYTSELTAAYTQTGGITAFSAAVDAAQGVSGFEVNSAVMDTSNASATVNNIPALLRTANTYYNLTINTIWNSAGGAPTYPTGYASDADAFNQASAVFASSGGVSISGIGIPDTATVYSFFAMQYIDSVSSVEIGRRTPTLAFTPT